MYAVEKGAKSAINECKYQFKNRRWNCPIVSKKGKLFGKYVKGLYSNHNIVGFQLALN